MWEGQEDLSEWAVLQVHLKDKSQQIISSGAQCSGPPGCLLIP